MELVGSFEISNSKRGGCRPCVIEIVKPFIVFDGAFRRKSDVTFFFRNAHSSTKERQTKLLKTLTWPSKRIGGAENGAVLFGGSV